MHKTANTKDSDLHHTTHDCLTSTATVCPKKSPTYSSLSKANVAIIYNESGNASLVVFFQLLVSETVSAPPQRCSLNVAFGKTCSKKRSRRWNSFLTKAENILNINRFCKGKTAEGGAKSGTFRFIVCTELIKQHKKFLIIVKYKKMYN